MCPILGMGDTVMNKTNSLGPCSYRGIISQFFFVLTYMTSNKLELVPEIWYIVTILTAFYY